MTRKPRATSAEVYATSPFYARMRAKAAGEKHYFNGRPCKRGHVAKKYTSTGDCTECARERDIAWYHANPSKMREIRQVSQPSRTAMQGKRRAAKMLRTPVWADLKRIGVVYAVKDQMQRELGIELTVDHDIPLQGELVSGLHVHNNLRILPNSANCSKSNKFAVA
jgi:hypothetical protein